MEVEKLDYATTQRFSSLVLDHLGDHHDIQKLRPYPQSVHSCQEATSKRSFPSDIRQDLVQVLKAQYEGLRATEAVKRNIKALENEGTFTVTTGHQCVLLTGPLFFPFKVLNTIRVAKELNERNDGLAYVPILWLATEDHDFEEVSHVYLNGQKLVWERKSGGAVGRMKLTGIESFLAQYADLLGEGKRASDLLASVQRAYTAERTLAEATRIFVNEIFGEFGILVLDADCSQLKQHLRPLLRQELVAGLSFESVISTNAQIPDKYPVQVTPREINLFYMSDGLRERITKNEDGYAAGDQNWSTDEILEEVDLHPERFSPNVLLRPLYQETILPNIAYIGGGGELAYWCQLPSTFRLFELPFPVVLLRTSAMILTKKVRGLMSKASIQLLDLFTSPSDLKKRMVVESDDHPTSVADQLTMLNRAYEALESSVQEDGLKRAIRARAQKGRNDLHALEKKLIRAAKRDEGILMDRIDRIYDKVMPNGALQERSENMSFLFIEMGESWPTELLNVLDPFDKKFTVIG